MVTSVKRWILQISSGSGPIEARRFVALLAPHLVDSLAARGQRVTADVVWGDPSTPKAIQIRFEGDGRGLDELVGTHALIARSDRRGKHARKRWFVGVELFQEQERHAVVLSADDVEITTCRSGGPGGQHVNRTESAVQAVHRPTGVRVRVESARSQHANKKRALELIARALSYRTGVALARASSERRMAHWRVQRGAAAHTYRLDARDRLVRDA